MAPHLLARFAGQPLAPAAADRVLLVLLGGALGARLAGAVLGLGTPGAAAGLAQAAVFGVLAIRVRRALDTPDLAPLRRQLVAASVWLAVGALADGLAGLPAALPGGSAPSSTFRAAQSVALLGGVLGWVLGVLHRAGPMFVPGWGVPGALTRGLPWALGAAAALGATGELAGRPGLARLGETGAAAMLAVTLWAAGGCGRGRGQLPLLGRSPAEARIFRIAGVSALAAPAGFAAALLAALAGNGWAGLLADAARHLLTVGVLLSVVTAMGFRLIVALEGRPLPWPRLPRVAFWLLGGAVVLRTAELGVGAGWTWLAPAVVASGGLAWLALALVAASLLGTAAPVGGAALPSRRVSSAGRPGSGSGDGPPPGLPPGRSGR